MAFSGSPKERFTFQIRNRYFRETIPFGLLLLIIRILLLSNGNRRCCQNNFCCLVVCLVCVRNANDDVRWTFSIARWTQVGLALKLFFAVSETNREDLYFENARKPLQRRTEGHFCTNFLTKACRRGVYWLVSSRVTPKLLVDAAGRPSKVRRTCLILRISTVSCLTLVEHQRRFKGRTRGTEPHRSAGGFSKSLAIFLGERHSELGAKTRKH